MTSKNKLVNYEMLEYEFKSWIHMKYDNLVSDISKLFNLAEGKCVIHNLISQVNK